MSGWLEHAVLAERGARHGFGLRGTAEPAGTRRPRQVHGAAVADAAAAELGEADAVLGRAPGVPVAVVTADCVPILLSAREARLVAAVHAGWRGLAAGVIEAALRAFAAAGAPAHELAAAIGPHIGPCCYEVDAPVLEALGARFGAAALAGATQPTRAGHARVDLGALARGALLRALPLEAVGSFPSACTRCDAARFESHRRDGPRSGRMVHWIAAAPRG